MLVIVSLPPDVPVFWAVVVARLTVTALALVLAQLWFFHYRDVFALGGYVWLVLVRDLAVVSLCALLVAGLRRPAAVKDQDPVLLEDEPPLRVPT